MNIFYLSANPVEAAQMHLDKHIVKMILETAQLLSTAHRLIDGDDIIDPIIYKATHKNHPCAKWCRESLQNYQWLYQLFCALCDEYTFRYNRIHLTDTKLRQVLKTPPKGIPNIGFTTLAQAMPVEYKHSDPIVAYRNYYIGAKNKFAVWTKRAKPDWYHFPLETAPI